jgi:predicted DNA-binding ribbon-helix-helix protein
MQAVSSEKKLWSQDKLKSFLRVCVLADLRSTRQVIIAVSSDRAAMQFKQRYLSTDDAIAIFCKM